MPNTAHAAKSHRQSEKDRLRNRAFKSMAATQRKRVLEAIKNKNAELAASEFKKAQKLYDKLSAKGVLHKNTAARLKSRLSSSVKALAGAKK